MLVEEGKISKPNGHKEPPLGQAGRDVDEALQPGLARDLRLLTRFARYCVLTSGYSISKARTPYSRLPGNPNPHLPLPPVSENVHFDILSNNKIRPLHCATCPSVTWMIEVRDEISSHHAAFVLLLHATVIFQRSRC